MISAVNVRIAICLTMYGLLGTSQVINLQTISFIVLVHSSPSVSDVDRSTSMASGLTSRGRLPMPSLSINVAV